MIWLLLLLLPGLLYSELRCRRHLALLAPQRSPLTLPAARLLPDLVTLAALTLVLMSLRPPAATSIDTGPGPAVALVVDVSLSMQAADQQQTRMSRARNELLTLIGNLPGSRFSLIPFAGEPVLQVPLTSDLNGLRFFIDNLHPGLIAAPGSGPEEAVLLAQKSLEKIDGERLIILVADGERTLAGPPPPLAGTIPVYTILTGDSTGSPLGAFNGAISWADPQRLAAIAGQTGGRTLNGERLTPAVLNLPQLRNKHAEAGPSSIQLALAITLTLLALRWMPTALTGRLSGLTMLALILSLPGCDRSPAPGESPAEIFARGLQSERHGEIESAIQAFAEAAERLDGRPRGIALYNQGTLLLSNGQETAAIEPLEQALLLMPGDVASRDNLLLAVAEQVAVSGDQGEADNQESGSGPHLSRRQAQQLLESVQLDPSAPPAPTPVRPPAVVQKW